MISLPIIQCCINFRNALLNISNCLCLLSTVNMRSITLMLWIISLAMFSTTSPTLQRLSVITLVMLLRLRSMSSINCIELRIRCYILLITGILSSSSLLIPLLFSTVITFPMMLRLIPTLILLITIRGIFRSKMGLLRKMYNQNKLYKNQ